MSLLLLASLAISLTPAASMAVAVGAAPGPAVSEELQYAEAALGHVMGLACDLTEVTSPTECRDVQRLPKSRFRVHLAKPSTWTRYRMKVMQQKRFLHPRDGVLVLDPYPGVQFGHLLFVFFIHSRFDSQGCSRLAGTTMADGKCLYPAAIPHCRTSLFWRATNGHPPYRHCEHHFLPLVAYERAPERVAGPGSLVQRLQCVQLSGFAACPELYPFARGPQCGPGRRRPEPPSPAPTTAAASSPTPPTATVNGACPSLTDVAAHCPLEQSCDQAVLVAGGWNPDAGLSAVETSVVRVYSKLRSVGFAAGAVQTFFADRRALKLAGLVQENLHAAGGMKVAFQQHIQRVCRTDYCLNNLVLYLRSPTLLDGSMLLWDFNNDYDVSRDEEYSAEELLADLSQCKARWIVVFLDVNFAERVAEKLRDLPNTMVIAASGNNHYTSDGLMSEVFFANASHLASPGSLAREFSARNGGQPPLMYGVSEDASIFGNRLTDPVTAGCRSLPTSLIVRRMAAAAASAKKK